MKDEKLKILLIVPDSPSPTGSGDSVRSYYFAKALAGIADVVIVILNADSAQGQTGELSSLCRKIIAAQPGSQSRSEERIARSRFLSWLHILKVLAMPWRSWWSDLLCFANGFGIDLWNGSQDRLTKLKWSQRALAAIMQFELSLAAEFGRPLPLWTLGYWEGFRAVRTDIARLLSEVQFDIFWYEHSPMYPIVEQLLKLSPGVRVVCNAQNIVCDAQRRIMNLDKKPLPTRMTQLQPRILEKVESAAFAASNFVITCSERDKSLALNLAPCANVLVTGNGVDTSYFKPSHQNGRANVPTILFTGSLDYPPNADAVKFFVEDIYPEIKRRLPHCEFVVAGRNAGPAMKLLGVGQDGVRVVTNPVDMRPQFEQAWVCVVPLRAGGGTRLKIPEAMAMERAVVSTRLGAEGVPYLEGVHLLLADEPREIADAVYTLLTDEALRMKLERNAAHFVRENYDWNSLTNAATKEILDHLRRPKIRGPVPKSAPLLAD